MKKRLAVLPFLLFQSGCLGFDTAFKLEILTMPNNHPATVNYTFPQSEIRLGNRDYINSVFNDVFPPQTSGQQNQLNQILQPEVRMQIGLFGGPCNIYSSEGLTDCPSGNIFTQETALPFNQQSTSSREARRLRVCESVMDLDWAVAAAVGNIDGASPTQLPTAAQITAAFQLFYVGQDPGADILSALQNLIAQQWSSPSEAWKALFLAVCVSPGWQIL
jgi:hypothetical protein